ncbi:hypothetical protein BU16DRAFT_529376 [Lophium mytilinum]|uniref:Uncharacterized protein n=1 Tax=Lophium mytilinum TaxID=390894 RepID=A0A6A6QIS3_9PEZI|nr:hypothetical protein BU16DRAFT_529376 [Lophium mytilinum]
MRINSVYETDASEEVAKPYTFVGCRGFSKIMSVKTMRYHKGNLDVQVLFDGRWVPFWLWLEDVDFDPPTGKIGFDLQRGWWKSTEKTFKLLELPAELRNAVYKHSLGSEIFPSHESSTDPETGTETIQVVLGRGWTEKLADGNTRDPREAGVDAPNLALTQVNKQIRGEALHYAWELMPKVFTSSSKLHEIGREMDQDLPFQSTGHIVLDFLTVDYINFFEVPLPGLHPHQILSTQPLGSCLDKDLLPNLKHLEIRFQSTKLGPATDPWGRTEDGYIRFESSFHTACHKVLIDWIMVFAVGYIKHIPRVELKGYVKTSLKQKWEAILADERKGIVHDLTTEKAVVQALTINNVPPACYCTKPCHFDGMQNIEARQGRDWEHVFPQKHRIAMMNHYSFDFND